MKLFQQAQLDVVILEVGLGGRLDATNIVDADIAAITSIALDHTDWLGADREHIGHEKPVSSVKSLCCCRRARYATFYCTSRAAETG